MSWASGTTVNTSEIWNYAFTKPASYIIRVNGSYYEAINGTTGKISYGGSGDNGGVTGTDAESVIQTSLDNASGGKVFLTKGTYPITTGLTASNAGLEGENWRNTSLTTTGDLNILSLSSLCDVSNLNFDLNNATTTKACLLIKGLHNRVDNIRCVSTSGNYTGAAIRLYGSGAATAPTWNKISRFYIGSLFDKPVHLKVDAAGEYCNGNVISNGIMHGGIYGFYIETNGSAECRKNTLISVHASATVTTAYYIDKAEGTTIIDPAYWDDPGGGTTGIYTSATTDETAVIGGFMRGDTVLDHNGWDLRIYSVEGLKTENSGDSTITSGTTSKTIAHGLNVTPSEKHFFIIGRLANSTNDPGNIWINGIDATNFTVNCRNDPGAANWTFSWHVKAY